MKFRIIILFITMGLNISAQDYFVKKIDFGNNSNAGWKILKTDERIFIVAGHFCQNLECSSVAELSENGDTTWVTELPDIDVGRSTIFIDNDTITVTGNNEPLNTRYRLTKLNLEGKILQSTIEIEDPFQDFTNMFQLSTVKYESKTLVSGAAIKNGIFYGLIYVLNSQNELDTLIQLEPQDRLSVLWDLELNNKGEFLTFHEIEEDAFGIWYRKINKFDRDFNIIWTYKSEISNEWNSGATGLEMQDGRVILIAYKPNSNPSNSSIRAINPDKSIDWQYFSSIANGYETTANIKQLSNGDLLGMGRYKDLSLDEPVFDAPFLYKMTTEGEIIWKRLFYEIDPETGNTRRGFVRDAVELDNGDIYGIGEMKKGPLNQTFIFKVDKNGCLDTEDCGLVQQITSSNDHSFHNEISIFPNPTLSNYVNLTLDDLHPSDNYSINIYNAMGKHIANHDIHIGSNKIDVGNEKGILIFSVAKNGNVVSTRRVVKL